MAITSGRHAQEWEDGLANWFKWTRWERPWVAESAELEVIRKLAVPDRYLTPGNLVTGERLDAGRLTTWNEGVSTLLAVRALTRRRIEAPSSRARIDDAPSGWIEKTCPQRADPHLSGVHASPSADRHEDPLLCKGPLHVVHALNVRQPAQQTI